MLPHPQGNRPALQRPVTGKLWPSGRRWPWELQRLLSCPWVHCASTEAWGQPRCSARLGNVRSVPCTAARGARGSSPRPGCRGREEGRGRPKAPPALTLFVPAACEPEVGAGVRRQLGKPCPRELTPSSCAHAQVACAGEGQVETRPQSGQRQGVGGARLLPETPARLRWGGAQIGSGLPMTPEVCRPGSRLCVARGRGRVVWTDLAPGRGSSLTGQASPLLQVRWPAGPGSQAWPVPGGLPGPEGNVGGTPSPTAWTVTW